MAVATWFIYFQVFNSFSNFFLGNLWMYSFINMIYYMLIKIWYIM
jgi:hypothetical protein